MLSARGKKADVDIELVFHAICDPTRRAILDKLARGPSSVSGLAEPLSITLTAVAQHLQVLEKGGLVRTAKVGRVRTCQLETAGFSALENWIAQQKSLWERRFDRLGAILDED